MRAESATVLAGLRSRNGPLSIRVRSSRSSMTVTAGQQAQAVPGERTSEVTLDPGVSADTPVKPRNRPEPARTGRGPSPARCVRSPGSAHDREYTWNELGRPQRRACDCGVADQQSDRGEPRSKGLRRIDGRWSDPPDRALSPRPTRGTGMPDRRGRGLAPFGGPHAQHHLLRPCPARPRAASRPMPPLAPVTHALPRGQVRDGVLRPRWCHLHP